MAPARLSDFGLNADENAADSLDFFLAVHGPGRKVTERHTIDYAYTLRCLSDVHFANSAEVVLVRNNLNTHKLA